MRIAFSLPVVLYTDDGLEGREAELESDRVEADRLTAFPGSDGVSTRQTRGLPFRPVLTGTGPVRAWSERSLPWREFYW